MLLGLCAELLVADLLAADFHRKIKFALCSLNQMQCVAFGTTLECYRVKFPFKSKYIFTQSRIIQRHFNYRDFFPGFKESKGNLIF